MEASKKSKESSYLLPQIDWSSSVAACLQDPNLQSFALNLMSDLTRRVINNLDAGVKVRSPSLDRFFDLDCVKEVSNTIREVNEEVVKVILEQKEKIWKDKELFDLVEDYFKNSSKTLDFCTAIDGCLNRARNSHLTIQLTVQQFDEEQRKNDGVGGSKKNLYSRTLKGLEKFKTDADIFTEELFGLLRSLCNDHLSLLNKLKEREHKLDKKLKSMNSWKWVSMILLGAISTVILVCTIVTAPIAVLEVGEALVVLAPRVLEVGKALASGGGMLYRIWKKYEDEVEKQRDFIISMHSRTFIANKELECIEADIKNLKTKTNDLLQNAEFATSEEDAMAVGLAIDEIRKKSTAFKNTIQDLVESNDKCRDYIRKARIEVLEKIKPTT